MSQGLTRIDLFPDRMSYESLGFVFVFFLCYGAFSALTLLVGCQEEHPVLKNLSDEVWRGYLLE